MTVLSSQGIHTVDFSAWISVPFAAANPVVLGSDAIEVEVSRRATQA